MVVNLDAEEILRETKYFDRLGDFGDRLSGQFGTKSAAHPCLHSLRIDHLQASDERLYEGELYGYLPDFYSNVHFRLILQEDTGVVLTRQGSGDVQLEDRVKFTCLSQTKNLTIYKGFDTMKKCADGMSVCEVTVTATRLFNGQPWLCTSETVEKRIRADGMHYDRSHIYTSKTVSLKVNFPPSKIAVTIPFSYVMVPMSIFVIIQCQTDYSFPAVPILWKKDGKDFDCKGRLSYCYRTNFVQADQYNRYNTTSTLAFQPKHDNRKMYTDYGGKFECYVGTTPSLVKSSTLLRRKYHMWPTELFMTLLIMTDPDFVILPGYLIPKWTQIKLQCIANAPKIVHGILWAFNGQPVICLEKSICSINTSYDPLVQTTTSTLTFTGDKEILSSGIYSCEVFSYGSTIIRSAELAFGKTLSRYEYTSQVGPTDSGNLFTVCDLFNLRRNIGVYNNTHYIWLYMMENTTFWSSTNTEYPIYLDFLTRVPEQDYKCFLQVNNEMLHEKESPRSCDEDSLGELNRPMHEISNTAYLPGSSVSLIVMCSVCLLQLSSHRNLVG